MRTPFTQKEKRQGHIHTKKEEGKETRTLFVQRETRAAFTHRDKR